MRLHSFTSIVGALAFLAVACLTGCGSPAAETKSATQADSLPKTTADSNMLVLALLPTIENLPYFFAEDRGWFRQNGGGIGVELHSGQFDCDTALLGGRCVVAQTDTERIGIYTRAGHRLTEIAEAPTSRKLVVCGRLRINKPEQLRLRTIAISRQSAEAIEAYRVMKQIGVDKEDALLPLINDLFLRTSMLDENQVDAALLPEPLATMAVTAGHKVVMSLSEEPVMGRLAATNKTKSRKDFDSKWQTVEKLRRQAADSLNRYGKQACLNILKQRYRLTPQAIDSLRLPQYAH